MECAESFMTAERRSDHLASSGAPFPDHTMDIGPSTYCGLVRGSLDPCRGDVCCCASCCCCCFLRRAATARSCVRTSSRALTPRGVRNSRARRSNSMRSEGEHPTVVTRLCDCGGHSRRSAKRVNTLVASLHPTSSSARTHSARSTLYA